MESRDLSIQEQLVYYAKQIAPVYAAGNLVNGLPPREECLAAYRKAQEELIIAAQELQQPQHSRQVIRESLLALAAHHLFVAACADAQSQQWQFLHSYFDAAGTLIYQTLYEKLGVGAIDAEKAARALYALKAANVGLGTITENRERDLATIRAAVPDPLDVLVYGQTTQHITLLLDLLKRRDPDTYHTHFSKSAWATIDLVARVSDPTDHYRRVGLA